MGTPVATLLGVWRYRVGAGTGGHGVNIPWLGEIGSLIRNLSVAARTIVWSDRSLNVAGTLNNTGAADFERSCPGTFSVLTSCLPLVLLLFCLPPLLFSFSSSCLPLSAGLPALAPGEVRSGARVTVETGLCVVVCQLVCLLYGKHFTWEGGTEG